VSQDFLEYVLEEKMKDEVEEDGESEPKNPGKDDQASRYGLSPGLFGCQEAPQRCSRL
jgi:hypothetical protein